MESFNLVISTSMEVKLLYCLDLDTNEQFYRISSPHRRFKMFCLRVETIPIYWVFG